jgi:AcrR family transcriptional regulator
VPSRRIPERGSPEVEEPYLPGELPRPDLSATRSSRASQVVLAARRILEREGRSALTMRRLADELGIRAPSLYKHFQSKSDVEMAIVEDALTEIGEVSHLAIRQRGRAGALRRLTAIYRRFALDHANLYRLATDGPLDRERLASGLEEWAGNPWYVVTGDPALAQALWSFAHGMVVLELSDRYPAGSDLEATWEAGVLAFEAAGPSAFRWADADLGG